jgi:2-keto-4-pentenoate hydratase/2-oxohepta-3-ene-1,7-dioic acid hydratase in catechol pathway
VVVTSKVAKDVSPETAKDFILGYTIGNDLTARAFQDNKRGGGQYTFSKSMDKFGPIGPVLLNAKYFDANESVIHTRVNGILMQNSKFDFIHSAAQLVSFLSTGK